MYSIISSLATPIIVINATKNYFAWNNDDNKIMDSNKIGEIYNRQWKWNQYAAASIFITGATAVVIHATKFQKPTPLILSAMAYRLVAIFLIAFATGYSGAAVNRWCYDEAVKKK